MHWLSYFREVNASNALFTVQHVSEGLGRAQSRRLQPTQSAGTSGAPDISEMFNSPIPIWISKAACVGGMWWCERERDHTPSCASGQEPLCPAGSLRRAARSRAPVPGAARDHASRSCAEICRQTLRRRPLFEYLCTDLMLAQRPRLATAWNERRS